eukprot:3689595-Prymnesium_polylepis.1
MIPRVERGGGGRYGIAQLVICHMRGQRVRHIAVFEERTSHTRPKSRFSPLRERSDSCRAQRQVHLNQDEGQSVVALEPLPVHMVPQSMACRWQARCQTLVVLLQQDLLELRDLVKFLDPYAELLPIEHPRKRWQPRAKEHWHAVVHDCFHEPCCPGRIASHDGTELCARHALVK